MLDSQVIRAKDCLTFEVTSICEEAIRHFAHSYDCTKNVFRFSPKRYADDDASKVLEYDYWQRMWRAGRYVGNASFSYNNRNYDIVIEPRYGELFLFKMIEEIFNVKLVTSNAALQRKNDFGFLIRRLISFIWLHKLANANKHGLPRHNVKKNYTGYNVKGRINVKKSVISLLTKEQVVSEFYEKEIDETIARILVQAYWILVKDYELGILSLPDNAREIINLLKSSRFSSQSVSQNEYDRINYKEIYQSFREVVDFSWDIINNKTPSKSVCTQSQNGFSFFIDMAEIWELYIRTALSKHLKKDKWKVMLDYAVVYEDTFFKRCLIPDIVVKRGADVAVFDAKYKAMNYSSLDVDRNDFFQIHTYMNYYAQGKRLLAGGLIYPLEKSLPLNCKSDSLFSSNETNATFFIDGFNVTDAGEFEKEKMEFLQRISAVLAITNT
ncbi:conserved hypothetical protein [Desulfofarcimen acetoxidans DSM 771]|uniref:5-methylcytosine restriction system component-like protein n=1 Tax=Desulfofarcimen acetoxidans (strain ATCC 49208 / DSM 771 / KCTC 5769 / VKM B-1644 / 5575) TaxID=485916 RepID=C8VZS1_DESAS|nr:hypothetical protein [Desulfofarcimen acetoxidans]ACV63049.1 conserved hypothetical protein [Desulfofarcimen acetoxidans DSM 771]